MTRTDILEAAAQIFSQKGYHGTSMQDIAFAVNLQKASLYYHFGSKQEILFALLNQALDLLIERVTRSISDEEAPADRLRRAMCIYLATLSDYQDLAAVLLLEHRSLEPDLQALHFPKRDAFEGVWRSLIQAGIDSGDFACTHPSLTARALLGAMNWTVTWFRRDGTLSAEEISEHFSELFLRGLIWRDGSEGEWIVP